MADFFDPTSCSSPPPPPPPPPQQQHPIESDDISCLLNTLLHNSSQPSTSSTSAHLILHKQDHPENRRQFPGSAVFGHPSGLLDSSSNLNFPYAGAFYSSGSTNRSNNAFSTSIPLSNEGIGDIDCDSEEQEEVPVNPAPSRSSSKRSRAAEVHNLSEKRRRQKINEKMKALQKLIPNSNKTDKASMLDEAIEYLKQLQLQVQMLTMRNGSNLHPFYLPAAAQSVQPAQAQVAPLIDETNSSSRAGSFAENQEASIHHMFGLSGKPAPSDYKLLMTRMSETSNSGPSVVLEQLANAHYRCFDTLMPSKVLCKDPTLPQLQLEMSQYGRSSSSDVSS